MICPPSTTKVCPVTNPASTDAKNATVCPISSGFPSYPKGIDFFIPFKYYSPKSTKP